MKTLADLSVSKGGPVGCELAHCSPPSTLVIEDVKLVRIQLINE